MCSCRRRPQTAAASCPKETAAADEFRFSCTDDTPSDLCPMVFDIESEAEDNPPGQTMAPFNCLQQSAGNIESEEADKSQGQYMEPFKRLQQPSGNIDSERMSCSTLTACRNPLAVANAVWSVLLCHSANSLCVTS